MFWWNQCIHWVYGVKNDKWFKWLESFQWNFWTVGGNPFEKIAKLRNVKGQSLFIFSWCPQLKSFESLILQHLKNLVVLFTHLEPFLLAFSSVKVLFLVKCLKIKMFSIKLLLLLQHIINLEWAIILGCDQIEEIMEPKEKEEIKGIRIMTSTRIEEHL